MPATPPPVTAASVQRRDGQKAQESLPDVPIELFRVWLPGRSRAQVEARRVKGRRAAVAVEGSRDLVGTIVEPPALAGEKLTANLARDAGTGDDASTAGLYRPHVPLSYKPKLVEKVRARKIREGSDLPNSVFAPDSRYIFQDTSFPWCTSGRVETSGGSCTGTMIGRRLMMTGSHCMQWTDTGAGWVKFTPAYYNGATPFGVAWGTRVIYWSRVDGSDGVSDQETAFDYVVIVLDRNMGDLTGYVGYRSYSDSWNGARTGSRSATPAISPAVSVRPSREAARSRRRSSTRPAARMASSSGTSSTRRPVTREAHTGGGGATSRGRGLWAPTVRARNDRETTPAATTRPAAGQRCRA